LAGIEGVVGSRRGVVDADLERVHGREMNLAAVKDQCAVGKTGQVPAVEARTNGEIAGKQQETFGGGTEARADVEAVVQRSESGGGAEATDVAGGALRGRKGRAEPLASRAIETIDEERRFKGGRIVEHVIGDDKPALVVENGKAGDGPVEIRQ